MASRDADTRVDEIRERLRAVPDPVALLEGIFAYAPVGLQVYSVDGHCLLTNAAFRRMFGSEPPPDYNVLNDEIAAAQGVLEHIRRAFAGETVELPPIWYDPRELTQVHVAEGRRVAIESTFFPLFDQAGAVSHVAIVFRDVTAAVTERERAEHSERRYRTLTSTAAQMFWTTDAAGMVVEDSPTWRAFTGQSLESWLGTGWLEVVHADDRAAAREAWTRAVATGSRYEVEYRVRRSDGTWAITQAHGAPVRDARGNVVEWVGMNVDVTEQRRIEREREQLLLRERAARAEAEAADRAKDEFLAMLGHELRNPLSPIVTALQLMKLRGQALAGREVQVIERQVSHLIRLVDDLLDVSRITRGKVELKRERVELAQVVGEAVEMASPLLEQRRHYVTVDVTPGLALYADRGRLAQVVANLLTNAARYTDPGGNVTLCARREDGTVALRVIDTGVGIAPELLPRVFDLFVQGPRTADRADGGLGLGLALVRSLVQMHGGTVEARSEGPGRGSEFVVHLPLVERHAADDATDGAARTDGADGAQDTTAAAASRARDVLVVDDNEDAAEMLAEALRGAGHRVEVAHDGPAALALLERFRPDVAVLDIGLPVMDGYELATRLRERVGSARLIALTGYGQESDRQRSRAAGFEQHLVKPIDPDRLLAAVDQVAP